MSLHLHHASDRAAGFALADLHPEVSDMVRRRVEAFVRRAVSELVGEVNAVLRARG